MINIRHQTSDDKVKAEMFNNRKEEENNVRNKMEFS